MTRPLPFTGPGANPLRLYLRGERVAVAGIEEALRDAMADAQRRINKLETKHGLGAIVRRAQLALIRRELRGVQEELWRAVNKNIRAASPQIAAAASEAEQVLQALLFQTAGKRVPDPLVEAQRAYAKRTVATYLARDENGISLSQRVYRSQQLSNGFVDRAVNRAVLQGGSWQDIAASVRPMINPDTPGGVSFAAKRLARTELNNAFHTTQKASADINPFVTAMRWNLSRSHPKKDKCDLYAKGHSKGQKAGLYLPGDMPDKPHPQCLCYTTNEMMDEDDFINLVTSEEFFDDVIEGYQANTVELKKASGGDVVNIKRPPAPKPKPKPRPPAPPKENAAALNAVPISITSPTLDPDKKSWLRQYKGVNYTQVNTYLRKGGGSFLKENVEELDSIFNKSKLKSDVIVYRGIKDPRAVLGDRVDGDLAGLEWIEDAYSSTSADRRIAEDFAGTGGLVMRIHVRKGAPMVKLSEFGKEANTINEAELLGGRGWQKRVSADKGVNERGIRIVEVEVVNHARNGRTPWGK